MHALNNAVRVPRTQVQLINFRPRAVNGNRYRAKYLMIGVAIWNGVAI